MGSGKGPINDHGGFFVSVDFKCFRKGVWGRDGANNDDEGFLISADFIFFRKGTQ